MINSMHDIVDSVIENAKILKTNKEENIDKDFEQFMSIIKKDKENKDYPEPNIDLKMEDALKTIEDVSSVILTVPFKSH